MYTVEIINDGNTYEINLDTDNTRQIAFYYEDVFSLSAAQSVFTLNHNPVINSVKLYVNGMLQRSSNYTVFGQTLTVTGFSLVSGDVVVITYEYVA